MKAFIRRQRNTGNQVSTIRKKLAKLAGAYEYWQKDAAFPHPQDYGPIQLAIDSTSFDSTDSKEPPRIAVSELRAIMDTVTNIRVRAIVGLQLKLGLRSGEVVNIQISDLHIENAELDKHYPDLGSNPEVEDRPNGLYIPSREERDGNKSRRARVLSLDDEVRRVLLRYLLIRPTVDAPWLFVSKQQHRQLDGGDANRAWKAAFGDRYPETERHSGVTSHFGRHRFTTYWNVEQDVTRELIKYMRGDVIGAVPDEEGGTIDTYIHAYYEDIVSLYRDNIFKLGI